MLRAIFVAVVPAEIKRIIPSRAVYVSYLKSSFLIPIHPLAAPSPSTAHLTLTVIPSAAQATALMASPTARSPISRSPDLKDS
jgi:hypothetical protein